MHTSMMDARQLSGELQFVPYGNQTYYFAANQLSVSLPLACSLAVKPDWNRGYDVHLLQVQKEISKRNPPRGNKLHRAEIFMGKGSSTEESVCDGANAITVSFLIALDSIGVNDGLPNAAGIICRVVNAQN